MKKYFVMVACLGLSAVLPTISIAQEVKPLTLTEYVAQLKKKQQQEQQAQEKKLAQLSTTTESYVKQKVAEPKSLHSAAVTGEVQLQVQSKTPEVSISSEVATELVPEDATLVIK